MIYQLNPYQRKKIDEQDDSFFYTEPRFVHHLDHNFRLHLTKYYENLIPLESTILDLMSSWVSHLPKRKYHRVIGHGMNKLELERNPILDSYWLQNLNINKTIPLDSNSLDYCLIVAGWQYLQYPECISREIYRVTKPNGRLVISFSNRAFWQKSPNIWLNSTDDQRINYVTQVLDNDSWVIDKISREYFNNKNLFGLITSSPDPFFNVTARKPDNP